MAGGGDPWFVLADVCKVLEIANSRDAAGRLKDDEKGVVLTDTLGGPQKTTIISEAGFYRLVLRSDKPAADRFQSWVVKEVLPAIRKTGGYNLAAPVPMTREQRLAASVVFKIMESAVFCFDRLFWPDNGNLRALYRDVILGIFQGFQESVLLGPRRFLALGAGHVLGHPPDHLFLSKIRTVAT